MKEPEGGKVAPRGEDEIKKSRTGICLSAEQMGAETNQTRMDSKGTTRSEP